jgi:DNA-binding NtrC family response regulator
LGRLSGIDDAEKHKPKFKSFPLVFLEISLLQKGFLAFSNSTTGHYWVIQASNEEEALSALSRSDKIAAVLLDIRLYGKMSGISLLSAIKAKWPFVEVIMVTAVTEMDQAISCFEKGAFYYLTKPFKLLELRTMLKNAVEKWECSTEKCRQPGQFHTAKQMRIADVSAEVQALSENKKVHFNRVLRDLQRRLILQALKASNGRQTVAAELLELHRNSLRVKMAALRITAKRTKARTS